MSRKLLKDTDIPAGVSAYMTQTVVFTKKLPYSTRTYDDSLIKGTWVKIKGGNKKDGYTVEAWRSAPNTFYGIKHENLQVGIANLGVILEQMIEGDIEHSNEILKYISVVLIDYDRQEQEFRKMHKRVATIQSLIEGKLKELEEVDD